MSKLMLFKELYDKWTRYPASEYQSYLPSLNSGIWNFPEKYVDQKIDFLNEWRSRVDKKTAIPDLLKISESFKAKIAKFSSLDLIKDDIQEMNVVDIYSLLMGVNGLGPTSISKYLHMHNSKVFMMWDNQIFRDYFHIKTVLKSTATPTRYFLFLRRMKGEMKEAINDYRSNNKQEVTLNDFRSHFNNETFARILDKYNYVTREETKKIIY